MDSLCAAYVALDAAAKAANVRIQSVERNRLKSGACVKMRGNISDVTAAVQRVSEAPLCDVVASAVISNPFEETVRLVEESAVRAGFVPKTKNA